MIFLKQKYEKPWQPEMFRKCVSKLNFRRYRQRAKIKTFVFTILKNQVPSLSANCYLQYLNNYVQFLHFRARFGNNISACWEQTVSPKIVNKSDFIKGCGSPDDYWRPTKIKSVLSVHTPMAFKFSGCLLKEKNNY